MISSETTSIGRKKALLATAFGLGAYLLIGMIIETRGDFGNGILFFIAGISNVPFLIVVTILFSSAYFFGGRAANAIIINNRNVVLTALICASLTTLAVIGFPIIAILVMGALQSSNFVIRIVVPAIRIFLSLLIIWAWVTYRIKVSNAK